jgi:outer membrane protein TolC
MSASGHSGSNIHPVIIAFAFLIIITPGAANAQAVKLSIKETLEKVQQNLPQLESYRQQAAAAKENISLAQNSLVPDVTAGYQVNMATYNNITGMNYPGFLVPISGPPSATNDMNFVPGTALGALVKWNPFTFGQRNAAIDKAAAQYKQANAAYNEQLFQYQYTAVNLYLEALYLKQVLHISEAVTDRYKVSLEQSLVLAKNGLKPGIDTAQFQSLILQTEIDYLQTEKTYLQKIEELTRLTGIAGAAELVVLTDSTFRPSFLVADSTVFNNHPYYQSIETQKNTTAAGLRELQRAWVPQLDIWGSLYARGSGVNADGTVHKADGLGLSRTNAGIGLQLSFPVLQFSRINIQKRRYRLLLNSDEARLMQARTDITKQTESALIQYKQDVKIADKTPVQLKIATNVYEGLKLSYEAGLIDYTRLYQSQYELTKAELNNATARLQLWRSLLNIAVAKGSLTIFTDQLK